MLDTAKYTRQDVNIVKEAAWIEQACGEFIALAFKLLLVYCFCAAG